MHHDKNENGLASLSFLDNFFNEGEKIFCGWLREWEGVNV